MKKTTDFKKLVLGSAGKKRVKGGEWRVKGGSTRRLNTHKHKCPSCGKDTMSVKTKMRKSIYGGGWVSTEKSQRRCTSCGYRSQVKY
jgi:transposase-like protein